MADPRPEAAQALADRFGALALADPDELIQDPQVDAVLIAASSKAHADLIVAAAAAGKAIFCEKPMSMTLADADRALAAVEEAGVVLQVGLQPALRPRVPGRPRRRRRPGPSATFT